MDKSVRDLIFTPLVVGKLSQIVPDFTMNLPGGTVMAPAQITSENGRFEFAIHFVGSSPPKTLTQLKKSILSAADTHVFEGSGYKGALIQKNAELHLHVRSVEPHSWDVKKWDTVVKDVEQSVGFTHGFQPWPAYRETHVGHKLTERWISCKLDLKQTSYSPISRTLWANLMSVKDDPLFQIIPTIAEGFGALNSTVRDGIRNLLWHFKTMELSDLPPSTKLLMVCTILDGLMKVLAGKTNPSQKAPTAKTWKAGCAASGLSWEKWGEPIFELFGKHRNNLAHGWLWVPSTDESVAYFTDYPKLCGGLNTLVAASCGYEGRILTNASEPEAKLIKDLK